MHVDARPVMIPITQKEAGLAVLLLGFANEPIDELRTVLVMLYTVTLQTKVYVSTNSGFFKQVGHLTILC